MMRYHGRQITDYEKSVLASARTKHNPTNRRGSEIRGRIDCHRRKSSPKDNACTSQKSLAKSKIEVGSQDGWREQ